MIALMHDGVIASFEIDTKYRPVPRRPKEDNQTDTTAALAAGEQNKTEAPRVERD